MITFTIYIYATSINVTILIDDYKLWRKYVFGLIKS